MQRDADGYEGPDRNGSYAAAIIDAAQRAVLPVKLEIGAAYDIVDADGSHRVLDTLDFSDRRLVKRGEFQFHDFPSFAEYVSAHKLPGSTIWADLGSLRVVGVLNGHEVSALDGEGGVETAGAAGWQDHRCALTLAATPEWDHWINRDNDLMPQAEFAQHVEDGLNEIVTPESAVMLEVATSLEAASAVDFKESTRLQSGTRSFRYEETTSARAGTQGTLEVPDTFELGLRPFEGAEPYRVIARLRYKISNGGLKIGYRLVRPADVARSAFHDVSEAIGERTGVPVYQGITAVPFVRRG